MSRARLSRLVFAVTVVVVMAVGVISRFEAWYRVGVPRYSIPFADVHNVLSGARCAAQGRDILVENPCDFERRPVNYPRVWIRLVGSGNEDLRDPIGYGVALLFCTALLWLARPQSAVEVVAWSLAVISPSVLFGIERGNTDLVIFALLCAVVHGVATARSRTAGFALTVAAAGKLFPIFASPALLLLGRKRARSTLAACSVLFAAYLVLMRSDLAKIAKVVPRAVSYSFGSRVWAQSFNFAQHGIRGVPWAAAIAGALLGAAAIAVGIRHRHLIGGALTNVSVRDRAAFVVGSTCYAGAFLLGNNFDYRLVFLLFTLPLLLWAAGHAPERRARRAAAALVVVMLLSLWTSAYWATLGGFDEACNWVLFLSLTTVSAGCLVATRQAPPAEPDRPQSA